jgi:hypothetical protein
MSEFDYFCTKLSQKYVLKKNIFPDRDKKMPFWNLILKNSEKMNLVLNGILDFEVYPVGDDLLQSCRGANGRGLFVACAGSESAAEGELLSKMLQAVGFDLEQDALVLWSAHERPFSFASLRNGAVLQRALFFGIPPKQAGLNLQAQPNQPLTIGGIAYLFSHSLSDIIARPELKRPLWEGMKGMFGV